MANVLFKGKTVYEYAFSYNESFFDVEMLSYEDIRKFVSVLERNIDKTEYQYVLFDFSDLFENADYHYAKMIPNEYFADFLTGVYLVKPLDENIAEQIENKYSFSENIINALRIARATIRAKKDYVDISCAARLELEHQKAVLIRHMNQVQDGIDSLTREYETCKNNLNELERRSKGRQKVKCDSKILLKPNYE